MSTSYLSGAASKRRTPQSEPIPGSTQVENSAGGYAWEVNPLERLRRFLILGTEGGSYYASEMQLTKENAENVRAILDSEQGVEAVHEIVAISVAGRAPKNDPAIFALAIAASSAREDVRRLALDSLPEVCRTGTHLFQFVDFIEEFRGWGRALKRAVGNWYMREDISNVAYQVVKYRQRGGVSHADVLRLAHPRPRTVEQYAVFNWLTQRLAPMSNRPGASKHEPVPQTPILTEGDGLLPLALVDDDGEQIVAADRPELQPIEAYSRAQVAKTPKDTVKLIGEFGSKLPREAIKTEHLSDPDVNRALLDAGMPMTALIRNLGNLTRYGVLAPMGEHTQSVVTQLTDVDRIRKARVHPIAVLAALATYATGRSPRGSNTWDPVTEIVDALDAAFYFSFGNVERTGKRTMLALDVSGSMSMYEIAGVPGLTPRIASAALALVQANVNDPYVIRAFAHRLVPITISPRQRLDDVLRAVDGLPFGGTDCALPMVAAEQEGLDIDTFVIYTDSETWAGRIHPAQALESYRQKRGGNAKLVVVGMVSNGFSIADPNDPGMLDCVGFDTNTPNLISEFSAGKI